VAAAAAEARIGRKRLDLEVSGIFGTGRGKVAKRDERAMATEKWRCGFLDLRSDQAKVRC
jgi:hypothetical protein